MTGWYSHLLSFNGHFGNGWAEDRDHDRQTEDVGTKTEEPAFEPPKPLHEAKPEPEITTDNHEEVVEPLVNKPLGIVHIHSISTVCAFHDHAVTDVCNSFQDSTPTEPLATVYPASGTNLQLCV